MFPDFDYSALDDPTFKEDAVREEIIAPILRRAGYKPTGALRVQRSKPLTHPFVMIGSKKHPVTIVPDYTLFHEDRPLMILDGKRPTEDIIRSIHVEQAYSYAIHPEIRCRVFGLCNGRQLSLFHTERSEPLFLVGISELDARWEEVSRLFSPKILKTPEILDFKPDLGLHAHRVGLKEGTIIKFERYQLQAIGTLGEHDWTVCSTGSVSDRAHMISFDLDIHTLKSILAALPDEDRLGILGALRRSPFQADLELQITIDCTAALGPRIEGEYEPFAPFRVIDVLSSLYDPTVVRTGLTGAVLSEEMPDRVFRLSRHY
jgi:hypothetical protein